MCWTSFGNNHFRSELIHLCTYTGIIIHLLRFSFILFQCFRLRTNVRKFTPKSSGLRTYYYIPRRKSGIYWIQVRRAAAAATAAAVEISLWTR